MKEKNTGSGKGGCPITNPTIAVVKVRYENFLEAWQYQKTIAKRTLDYTQKNYELRKEADDIIIQIWNEVENTHSTLPEDKRMLKVKIMALSISTEKMN